MCSTTSTLFISIPESTFVEIPSDETTETSKHFASSPKIKRNNLFNGIGWKIKRLDRKRSPLIKLLRIFLSTLFHHIIGRKRRERKIKYVEIWHVLAVIHHSGKSLQALMFHKDLLYFDVNFWRFLMVFSFFIIKP